MWSHSEQHPVLSSDPSLAPRILPDAPPGLAAVPETGLPVLGVPVPAVY